MANSDLAARIIRRAGPAAVRVDPELAAALGAYLELLGRWNKKINLTGLAVDPPNDEAIDRLIIEPLAAARHLRAKDRLVLDVGSGGGSPAVPMKLGVPALDFVLIEAKVRKAAFLREAIRQLGLAGVQVENCRVEDLGFRQDLRGQADVVTLRAVCMDARLLASAAAFLKPGGRVFAFVTNELARNMSLPNTESVGLVPALESRLLILKPDRLQ